MFSELPERFLQHFGNSISRPSRVTTVPCQTVKNGRPGRPSVDIPPEVLEDLRGLGFTWEKIARIFRVFRWTIMRRVRSFDLEHLSLFSTMSDEKLDSIIQDFIARHGSTILLGGGGGMGTGGKLTNALYIRHKTFFMAQCL